MGVLQVRLSSRDREFALQGMEQAKDALEDVLLICRRRHVKKGDLSGLYPEMSKVTALLLRIQQLDCGQGDKP